VIGQLQNYLKARVWSPQMARSIISSCGSIREGERKCGADDGKDR
jgi:hypothetical protein